MQDGSVAPPAPEVITLEEDTPPREGTTMALMYANLKNGAPFQNATAPVEEEAEGGKFFSI